MNNKKIQIPAILPKLLTALLIVFLGVGLLSSCGSAGASTKKSKSKKSKVKADSESEKAENESKPDAETDEAEDKPSEEDEKEKSEKESGEKEADKKSEDAEIHVEKKKESDDKKPGDKSAKKGADEKKDSAEADAIWADLMKGNKRFMAGKHTSSPFIKSRHELAKSQKPQVIVLGCSDSRVPPELVFDKNLGELFVIRDAGNVSDAVSLGSIEYAVEHLHAKMIVVLGHESCGAVAATVKGGKMPTKNLQAIIDRILPALEGEKSCPLGGESNLSCVKLNVKKSAKDILMNSPIIKEAMGKGELSIVESVYQMETGEVTRLN